MIDRLNGGSNEHRIQDEVGKPILFGHCSDRMLLSQPARVGKEKKEKEKKRKGD